MAASRITSACPTPGFASCSQSLSPAPRSCGFKNSRLSRLTGFQYWPMLVVLLCFPEQPVRLALNDVRDLREGRAVVVVLREG